MRRRSELVNLFLGGCKKIFLWGTPFFDVHKFTGGGWRAAAYTLCKLCYKFAYDFCKVVNLRSSLLTVVMLL